MRTTRCGSPTEECELHEHAMPTPKPLSNSPSSVLARRLAVRIAELRLFIRLIPTQPRPDRVNVPPPMGYDRLFPLSSYSFCSFMTLIYFSRLRNLGGEETFNIRSRFNPTLLGMDMVLICTRRLGVPGTWSSPFPLYWNIPSAPAGRGVLPV